MRVICIQWKGRTDGKNRQIHYIVVCFSSGGDSRAEYLRKKHYFKCVGEHCYLQPWNYGNQFVKGGITLGLHFFIFEAVNLLVNFLSSLLLLGGFSCIIYCI